MFIRTERLFLRPGWPEDWRELHGAIADEAIVRNLARAPWPYSPDDARDFIALPRDPRLPRFLVTLPGADGARIIGGCGLHADEGEVALGYWLARHAWGKGYATEAACALLGLARALGHRKLAACHAIDNPASGRVLRKAGFRPTGRVTARHSAGRGEAMLSALYAIDLADGGDSDNSGGDDAMTGKIRRAA
ncbi:MAG: GNAT family N-acetyltransferase [Sphingomonadales bacterium]|nr:GNAT family N-acetyltransferase [Sphingomonadales bacterium]MDE2568535.1 GNAT family N-acetyltransferase [Sphingomonadales bacterium]